MRQQVLIMTIRAHTLCAVAAAVLGTAAATAAPDTYGPDRLTRLTGARTRVVWVQDQGDGRDTFAEGNNLLLVGVDSEEGNDEIRLVEDVGNYCAPVFSPDGRQVLVSDLPNFRTLIVDWETRGASEFARGLVLDTQYDPQTGISWAYIGTRRGKGKGMTVSDIHRLRIDRPSVSERVWDQTAVSLSGFHVSRDGRAASGLFPWPNAGRATLPNVSHRQVARGCWTSMAPDSSRAMWVFDGAHRNLTLVAPDGRTWKFPINTAAGIDNFEVYHPRWSNHARYMAMSGPYRVGGGGNRIRGGGEGVEIYVGRFGGNYDAISDWCRVTDNKKADFFPDVWVDGGRASFVPRRVSGQPPAQEPIVEPAAVDRWPGHPRELVFAWENADTANRVRNEAGKTMRVCNVMARGRAVFGPYFDMRPAGGSMVAEDVDEALLKACRRTGELTLQALITPANVSQRGPARIISFSSNPSRRNVTLGQEGDQLVLRLRTPRTGPNGVRPQVTLGTLEPERTCHVVATYRPGELTAYFSGRQVLRTDAVQGDFDNWEPSTLLFGNEATGDRPWHGALEGIAIHSRWMSAEEAARVHALYATQLEGRRDPPRAVVRATLLATVPTPAPADIHPYRRCLAEYTYRIEAVASGTCDADRVLIAHWVMLDAQPLPQTREIGKTYTLAIEPWTAHPELKSERTMKSDDLDTLDLPVFYDVDGF